MDFMKILDQTVREIRREVNLKVLKVPEIEQKVLDATNNEPWGPHGSALSEIAEATKKFTDCQMVMNVLWTRLTDTGTNWRHVYKALAVIEYLIANGSERALDDILEHSFQISSISGFEFVESNGKDVGINVRKKVETILALLNDKEKIKAVRDKAAANHDKYFGLSSTGITYKSSSKSYGSSDFHHDRYGGIGGPREDDSFKDSYQDAEGYEEETNRNLASKDGLSNSKGSLDSMNEGNKLRKAVVHHTRDQDAVPSSTMKPLTKPGSDPAKSSNVQPNSSEDDFDDFDPRGSPTAGLVSTNGNEVDLLGQSLLIDLMDAPTSFPAGTTAINYNATSEIDLFADATFVSASSHAEATGSSDSQGDVDFFANQPTFPPTYSSSVDLFVGADANLSPETKSIDVEPASTRTFDPFAAVPLDNLEGSDFFGAFTSHTDPVVIEPSQNSTSNINNMDQTSSTTTKAAVKKDTFQVKSGIWAGSLSRGLIDLNLTAPKMASLADVGIIGGLGDGSDEKGPTSPYVGSAMGAGSNLGLSGFTTTTMAGNGNMSALGQRTVWKL